MSTWCWPPPGDGEAIVLNKSKLLALALLVTVFAAGAVVGAALFSREPQAETADRRSGDDRDGRRGRGERSYIGWLDAELTLAPAQRDTIERILDGYQGAMREISASVRPRVDSIRTQIRGEIMSVLRPEQQEQYRLLTTRSDSSRKAERERDSLRHVKREGTRDK
jgi:Spy/CpxP family protein refolding chaperone